jgi:hypothetical protein
MLSNICMTKAQVFFVGFKEIINQALYLLGECENVEYS